MLYENVKVWKDKVCTALYQFSIFFLVSSVFFALGAL